MKNKGCLNEECEAFKKKHYYNHTDNFCPKCGQPLFYVCQNKNCFKPVNSDEKYCKLCDADRKDKQARTLETIEKAGGVLISVAGPLLLGGKGLLSKGGDLLGTFRKK